MKKSRLSSKPKYGFPYAPTFHLKDSELEDKIHADDLMINAISETSGTHPDLGPKLKYLMTKKEQKRAIIAFLDVDTYFLSGFGRITDLCGTLICNGFRLNCLEAFQVLYPPWTPAIPIELNNSKSSKGINCNSIINKLSKIDVYKDIDKELLSELLSGALAVFIVEGMNIDETEWLLQCENRHQLFNNDIIYEDSFIGTADALLVGSSFLIGTRESLSRNYSQNSLMINQEWHTAISCIRMSNMASRRGEGGVVQAIVCGSKGVGKSTFIRYLVNRLLNNTSGESIKNKHETVAFIECDLGQPEFNIPGMLSLHFIREPILAIPHLNLRTPELAYYFGDVTTKNDPVQFLKIFKELYNHYLKMNLEHINSIHNSNTSRNNSNTNSFTILDLDCDTESSVSNIPLIVNTDGWVKNIGSELLGSLIELVGPSHLVHICPDTTKDLEPLQRAPPECVIMTVTSAVTTPSRIPAVDLRNLRLVAYFLRSCQHPSLQAHKQRDITPSSMLDTFGSQLSIRNGSILDPNGLIAISIAASASYTFSLAPTSLCFRLLGSGQSVPPRLVLAAFNGCLVGLADGGDLGEKEDNNSKVIRLRCPIRSTSAANEEERGEVTAVREFEVDVGTGESSTELLPVIGFGIIQSIDVLEGTLRLISPVPITQLTSLSRLCLLRGQQQLPSVLLYAPVLPVFNYSSGELEGEGGGVMKGRANLKRRSQQS